LAAVSKRVTSAQLAARVRAAGMQSALRPFGRAQDRPFDSALDRPFETRPGKRAAPQGERV